MGTGTVEVERIGKGGGYQWGYTGMGTGTGTGFRDMRGLIWLFPHSRVQNEFMEGVGSRLTGLPVGSMNLKFVPQDELFFAKTVIQVLG